MRRGYKKKAASVLAVLLVAGTLTACGSAKTFSQQMVMETAAASADSSAMAGGTLSGSYHMKAAMPQPGVNSPGAPSYDMEAVAETTAAAGYEGSSDGGGVDQPAEALVKSARKLIRNVNLQVETTDFDALLAQITQEVGTLGGYIEQSDVSGSSISASQGDRRYAYLTARVPSDKLDGFIAQVDAKGNITNRSENIQDVTLQYTDIESRKKTLVVEQDRLWDLLAKADSVDAVIALESRLSEIRYQLESLESQLRTYDNQVDYSTVYLSIDEVKVFTPTAPDSVGARIQKGFQRNLEHVGTSMVNFFVWFISSLPSLLVFAAIITAIFFLVRTVVRVRNHRSHTEGKPMAKKGKSTKADETSQSMHTAPSEQPAPPAPSHQAQAQPNQTTQQQDQQQ
ncbi:MAG: DUF4349 domain-containing protein [Lachnospiraceae bacterium]|nr:DUF4349 domain-containing protein [Lachnospiraceae bacterium]